MLDSLNLERYSVYLYIEEDKKYFVMAEEVPLNGQKEDNDFINLKNESECDGRLHGFIYLYGYDPDLKEKVPLFVQANISKTCKLIKVHPTVVSLLRMRTMTSLTLSDDPKSRRSFQQLPAMDE